MANEKKLCNIESIIKEMKKSIKVLVKLEKLDGITMECSVPQGMKAKEGIKEAKAICKKLKLGPLAVEENPDKENVFALQFPELDVEYTEKQIEKMYKANYKWLLEGLLSRDKDHKVTRELLLEFKDVFNKQAIMIYCKSNINPYKTDTSKYLNNIEYRKSLDKIYYDFIEENMSKGVL